MTPADWIAIASGAVNVLLLYIVALINAKISGLRADMYKTFLTKHDFFEYQNRRAYNATTSNRRK